MDIWEMLCENFDNSLPRMNAITIKESDYDLGHYWPTDDGKIGYNFLDSNKSLYNQGRYQFEFHFAVYEYPDLCRQPGKTRFLYEAMQYRPGQISHNFHLANSALAGVERLSATDKALNWHFDLKNTSCGVKDAKGTYTYSKKIYSVFKSHDYFTAKQKGNVVEITLPNHKYYIASKTPIKTYLFDNEFDAYDAIKEDFTSDLTRGRYLLIENAVKMGNNDTAALSFGLSHHGEEYAINASEITTADDFLRDKWNNWFKTIPAIDIENASEDEVKLYYKCWWALRLNYCNDARWGFCVMESLPVYKGLWQWAIPAIEWYSSQDKEHPCTWIKSAMDILLSAQREDGYITHAAYLDEETPGERWYESGTVQNPQLPGTALRYYNTCGDLESLKKWYPAFKKYYDYLCREFDEAHKNYHLWALHSSYDTGLDTFPAYEQVTYGLDDKAPTEYCYGAILSAERYNYERCMAEISRITGLDDADIWEREARITKDAINDLLWDRDKCWYGVLQEDGTKDTRVGVDGLFPIIYGIADDEKLAALEPQFKRLIGEFGIRTCAEGEEGYFSDIYWRGPCWPKAASLGVYIAKKYFPHLADAAMSATLKGFLKYPNIWECIDVTTGKLARSNNGFYSTPCMSSNVGAGELMGALWLSHGMDMFGIGDTLPLIPMKDYHHKGLWITIEGDKITAKAGEAKEANVKFIIDNEIIKITVKA